MKYVIAVFCLILLTACQTLPSPSQTEEADYGIYPDNYEAIAKQYLTENLRDPETSAVREIVPPVKRWVGDKVTATKFGYLVCAEVNSKNLFGKMTGFRYDGLLIRNGEVIKYIKEGELVGGMKVCN